MPKDLPAKAESAREPNFWRGLARDLLVAALVVALVLVAIYAYAGVWPPLVVVESGSMQHGDRESFLGVIDTGDMVFQQTAPNRESIVTYLEGRAAGYHTYGDYGDVIIFNRGGSTTPVIHRAVMYITLHANDTADVPDILRLPESEWEAWANESGPTRNPYYLRNLTIQRMGYEHDLTIRFNFASFLVTGPRTGYVTMGDNNANDECGLVVGVCIRGYDTGWIARQQDVIGRARGEIPWLGLLKLTLSPTDSCCSSWGHPEAPKNSWDLLAATLVFLVALPFIVEYAARGWTRYVSPHMPKIPWPWRRASKDEPREADDLSDRSSAAPDDPSDPPRGGSSGP